MARRIVIASSNQHKLSELRDMLARVRIPELAALEVVSANGLPEYGSPPVVEETELSFVGNAALKADAIASWLRTHGAPREDLVLADDSGLCVDAFDGQPGIYSARFAGPDASDADNNAKLVAELRARSLESSPGEFVCVLAIRRVSARPFDFTLPDSGSIYMRDNCLCIEGRVRGDVRVEARGDQGFGYDPHFWIDAGSRTFAELSSSDKAQRSHRGAATRRLVAELINIVA